MDLACQKAQRTLFEGVSLAVPAGSWLHIEGGNGCGKTSLLRILCGLAPAARGQVIWPAASSDALLATARPSMHRPDRSVLHYIGHALGLKPDLSACENLCLDAQVSGLRLSHDQALQALAAQGLKSFLFRTRIHVEEQQALRSAHGRPTAFGIGLEPVHKAPLSRARDEALSCGHQRLDECHAFCEGADLWELRADFGRKRSHGHPSRQLPGTR
jgi:ABC-type uncharacterized transport system fused permease/ATPase subunit